MDKPIYKLSSVLCGHTSDVRAIAAFADGTIVSTSRDKTARVWTSSGNDRDYTCSLVLTGHTNFVSAVCVIEQSAKNPEKLIVTGGNDSLMCVYALGQAEPMKIIRAHQNTVCKLRAGKEAGTFLSSSWDLSAKLWDVTDLDTPKLSLVGHTASVWCVADLLNGSIVTGSADKTVLVWTRNGSILHRLEQHTDCVRDIAPIKDDEFLTCANDAIVYHWSGSTGACLGTYCGHTNYIYSIIAMDQGAMVFTSGEDRTIRVWLNGETNQTINLPAQSVWCLEQLSNGDVVSGSSDGIVRIFSTCPARYADPEILMKFEKEAADAQINAELELGGIKIKDLPDKSALEQPGQKDGQTKIVKDGDALRAYSWSQNERKWMKIGDVMGASGGSAATSGKQLYNGIEYDYVFSVDIQDGVPPLKLPYNRGQDPWHVAQKFLHDNELSQLFLEQVANFIVKNSEAAPTVNTRPQFADPFTGCSRYIPAGSVANNVPSSDSKTMSTDGSPDAYLPRLTYLRLKQANPPAILDKLRELNSRQNDDCRVPEERLQSIAKLIGEEISGELSSDAISTLTLLFKWSDDTVFPVLDVTRLAILHKEANDSLCTDALFETIRKHIKPNANRNNQMLVFRLLANMFCHEKGEKLCLSHKDDVLAEVLQLDSLGTKSNQIAVTSYVLNAVVALNKYNDMLGKTQFLNAIVCILPRLNDEEATFRALVALGTLISGTSDSEERSQLIAAVRDSEVILKALETMSANSVTGSAAAKKLADCSRHIIDLIV